MIKEARKKILVNCMFGMDCKISNLPEMLIPLYKLLIPPELYVESRIICREIVAEKDRAKQEKKASSNANDDSRRILEQPVYVALARFAKGCPEISLSPKKRLNHCVPSLHGGIRKGKPRETRAPISQATTREREIALGRRLSCSMRLIK